MTELHPQRQPGYIHTNIQTPFLLHRLIQTVTKRITDRIDESLKPEVVRWAANYDHRLKLGNKPIYHLEAFVAKVMFIQVRIKHLR